MGVRDCVGIRWVSAGGLGGVVCGCGWCKTVTPGGGFGGGCGNRDGWRDRGG